MSAKNDKQCADVAKGMATLISSVVAGLDWTKESEIKNARLEVIKLADAQIEKIKAVAEAEIVAINDKAAAERKTINDRAAVERQNVREKLNAELKSINEEVEAELKKIDDMILQRKLAVVKGIGGVIASTGMFDSIIPVGKKSKRE